MIAWPAALPQAPLWDYGTEPVAGLADPEEARNPVRTRTYPEHEAVFRFSLSTTQWAALRAWYTGALNEAGPFGAPWLAALGYEHHFCRFAAPPAARSDGLRWLAELTLEIIALAPEGGVWLPEGGEEEL